MVSKMRKPACANEPKAMKVMKAAGNEIRKIDHLDRTYQEFCADILDEYKDYKIREESFKFRDRKTGRLGLASLHCIIFPYDTWIVNILF